MEQTQRGEFEKQYLKRDNKIYKIIIWILIIVLIVILGSSYFSDFIDRYKQQGATDILEQYASNGIVPIYLNQSGNITLTFISLEDYATGWCQRIVEANINEICGGEGE